MERKTRHVQRSGATLGWLWGVLSLSAAAVTASGAEYASEVQPLFAQHCLECHGPDSQKGDLRLDQAESAHRVTMDGTLFERITSSDPDERMPPEGPGLEAAEVDALKAWMDEGAPFAQHWAYRPLAEEPLPQPERMDWVRHPIDRFVLAKLEQEGVGPSPEADRPTLIKRLYYDLIGLPPTVAEVDAFVEDRSPTTYADLVKRLLASQHFGERWGRHWLDKARYADSDGYEKDRPRPHAWHYRDWVIEAVNADMPMDRFTVEQLAGDLLPQATADQRLATAFHRQTLTNTEGGTDQEQFRVEAVFDRAETTGAVWLGLTYACARCHNHKYDALSQAEYYQMFAFFNEGEETTMPYPRSEEAMREYASLRRSYEAKGKRLRAAVEQAQQGHEATFREWQAEVSERLAKAEPMAFHDLEALTVESSGSDAEVRIEPGGVLFVQGAVDPDGKVVTTVRGTLTGLSSPLTGLRLDALTDARLPQQGPGRAPNGNFVLNEIEWWRGDAPLKFGAAEASHSQSGFAVGQLIDGKVERSSGWAVAPQTGRAHHATLTLSESVTWEPGEEVVIRLTRNYDGGHRLGRFRLRLITGTALEAIAPEEVRAVLAVPQSERGEEERKRLRDYFLSSVHGPTREAQAAMAAWEKTAPSAPTDPVRVMGRKARPTHVLARGDFLQPAEEVQPGGLEVLPPVRGREAGKQDRLDLARWLMSEENPLTPRVLVNQVWEKLFGEGLVPTLNDFGVRGEAPTHPQLLDWLAAEYRRLGWSRKRLIESIVLSSTYRQSSAHRAELSERDPTNRWLARQNRFRVEAETVRDLSLAVAGLLSRKIGGPSVFPPMPPEVAALSYANSFKWENSEGSARYRRGMYTFFKRTAPHPNLVAFDCPDSNTTSLSRRSSNTPIQALTTLNNETFVEAAQALAQALLSLPEEPTDEARVTELFRRCVARPPAASEVARFLELLGKARAYYMNDESGARQLAGAYALPEVAVAESAAWTTVARIALNLDEFITRE